jgi:hypothetical protein
MNILLLKIRPKHTTKVRILVEILAGIMPATSSATVLVKPGERIRKVSIVVVSVHSSRQTVLT